MAEDYKISKSLSQVESVLTKVLALTSTAAQIDNAVGSVRNVKDYGAVGDGITDDTAAIQAAINASVNLPGKVWFPGGSYVISAPLVLNSWNTLLSSVGTVLYLKNGSNCSMLTTPNDSVQRNNIWIRGLELDGNAVNQSGNSPVIDIYAVLDLIISDLWIQHSRGSAIRIGNETGSTYNLNPIVDKCIIRGHENVSLGHGIELQSHCSDAIITSNDIGWHTVGAGIVCSGGADNELIGNKCWQNLFGFQTYNGINTRLTNCFANLNHYQGFILQNPQQSALIGCQAVQNSYYNNNIYSGFHIEGISGRHASDIIINGCLSTGSQQKYGLELGSGTYGYIDRVNVTGGNFVGNTSGMFSGTGVNNTAISLVNVGGFNPAGYLGYQPSVPASAVNYTNANGYACQVYIYGGTVTVISLGGTATGLTSGQFIVGPGENIAITYSSVPTWKWFGM